MMITSNKDEQQIIIAGRGNKTKEVLKKLPKRFPFRLHAMLNDAEAHGNDHIVSWLPCGKLFKVHKHQEFASHIMPLYCRHTKYKSFLRQLSMYKFVRTNKGPQRGCYHHPNFERNRFDLIEKINRVEQLPGSAKTPPTKRKRSKNTKGIKTVHGILAAPATKAENDAKPASRTSESDDEFELIDFANDSNPVFSRPEESKPVITISRTRRSAGLAATMSNLSNEPGLFDLRQDAEPAPQSKLRSQHPMSTLPSTLPRPTLPLTTLDPHENRRPSLRDATSSLYLSLRHSPFHLPNAPQDIVEEIINTFGKTTPS